MAETALNLASRSVNLIKPLSRSHNLTYINHYLRTEAICAVNELNFEQAIYYIVYDYGTSNICSIKGAPFFNFPVFVPTISAAGVQRSELCFEGHARIVSC